MSLRTSLKNFIGRDAAAPSLRERAASLRASVSTRAPIHPPLPAPGSAEAKAAFAAACREHSIRTNPPGGWPDLAREGDQIWTRHHLGKAMDSGEITPAEYARLYPLASERELQIETVGHELNLGALFALAYADEYPIRDDAVEDGEGGLVRDILAFSEPAVEADAELLRLGQQFDAARKREIAACEACNAAQREAARHMPERPACLILRPEDEPFNLAPWSSGRTGEQVFPRDIDHLRKHKFTREIWRVAREGETAWHGHNGKLPEIVPWPEAQARAKEIVTAWDDWCAAKATVGMRYDRPGLEEAADEAGMAAANLAHAIAALPARTAAGFRVKLRVLKSYNSRALPDEIPDEPDLDQLLSHSLWRDAQGELLTVADPVDWNDPPPGFMASPAIEPFSFARIPDAIGLELDRLHGIAVAEFKRRGGPEKSEAEQAALRRELHLDELNYVPPRENGEVPKPALDTLSVQILTLWPAWAAHAGDDGTDEQTAAYEEMQQRRFALLDAADALPATPDSIQAKALALAWLHYVNEWRQGQKRDDYSTDGRLAIDIHMAALAQGELRGHVVPHLELSLVDQIDFASVSLNDLQALHDIADLVGGVAYATAWTGRCKARGPGDHYNAAGELMQRLGDALTDVESAAIREARRRQPTTPDDRETRLKILAMPVIENGDLDETEAFARELAAHAEAERAGR
ncbi:hypothetical protein MBRA_06380 [Methylobacterium brachiatum]|nr:hypothetical protein MBRA_06380 [Methylobacterium brachiatum]